MDEYYKLKVECIGVGNKEVEWVDLIDVNWVIMFVWNFVYFWFGYS